MSIPLTSCKEGTKEKIKQAEEAVVDEAKDAAESVGEAAKKTREAVEEAARDVKDALVEGTDYHATGTIPCKIEGQPGGNCDFGVRRIGKGNFTCGFERKKVI